MRAGAIVAGCGLFSWLTILVSASHASEIFINKIKKISPLKQHQIDFMHQPAER